MSCPRQMYLATINLSKYLLNKVIKYSMCAKISVRQLGGLINVPNMIKINL